MSDAFLTELRALASLIVWSNVIAKAVVSAIPLPAMSSAEPWPTEVRIKGKPNVNVVVSCIFMRETTWS